MGERERGREREGEGEGVRGEEEEGRIPAAFSSDTASSLVEDIEKKRKVFANNANNEKFAPTTGN